MAPTLTPLQVDSLLQKYKGDQRGEFLLIGVDDDSNPKDDKFNDWIGYVTKEGVRLYPGTTAPGTYYTKNRMAPPHGAAHYVIGFHKNLFQEGMHFDQVALRQVTPAKIWRDDNDNFKQDASDFTQTGLYGMNLHSAKDSDKIYNWSAGCQVVQMEADHKELMNALRQTAAYKADPRALFSYLLVTLQDVKSC